MQRAMRRPSSRVVAEHAGRPRVDLHVVEVGDPAPRERGDVVGVLLRREDRVHRLGHQQRGPHAVDRRATRRISPLRHRHDDLDAAAASGPGTTTHAHLRGRPGRRPSTARASALSGSCSTMCANSAPSGTRPDARSDLDRAFDLVAGQHVERMRVSHALLRCQRVLTTRTASAKRPSGSPASSRVHRRSSLAPSSRSPPGSGSWLLCAQQRLDLAVDRVGDVDVVRRLGAAGAEPHLVDRPRLEALGFELGVRPPVARVGVHRGDASPRRPRGGRDGSRRCGRVPLRRLRHHALRPHLADHAARCRGAGRASPRPGRRDSRGSARRARRPPPPPRVCSSRRSGRHLRAGDARSRRRPRRRR